MKQVSQAPQRPSSINPEVSPALDAVVMRALEKRPRRPLPERRRLHRRARRRAQGGRRAARRHGRLRAAAAGRGVADAEAAEMDEIEEEERRRRRWLLDPRRDRGPGRRPDRLRADPRHDRRGPESDRAARSNAAEARLEGEGFKIGEIKRGRAAKRRRKPCSSRTRSRARSTKTARSSASSARSRRSTSRSAPARAAAKVPSTAGQPLAKATAKLEDAGFEVQVDRVNSDQVDEGLVIHSDPSGGTTR